ncbi:MAG: hypothetical protein M3220_08275 [Chloroflexota bacterium]|nr:hypothetical protein [Chloroflexota bacterium]
MSDVRDWAVPVIGFLVLISSVRYGWRRWIGVLTLLLIGNGMDTFAEMAFYGQPHNLYIYLLLQYGEAGLVMAALLFASVWGLGWQSRTDPRLADEPLLDGLWVALLSYFVIGLVESNLLSVEPRMLFFLTASCYIGLMRELITSDGREEVHQLQSALPNVLRPATLS